MAYCRGQGQLHSSISCLHWKSACQLGPHWNNTSSSCISQTHGNASMSIPTHKNNQKISCQASELLAMFPIVRHFVHIVVHPSGHCPAACHALLSMAQAIDHVHDGNQAGTITRASLLTAMEEAIQSFAKAFDVPLIKKLHWMLHLPDALTRYGTLPNCLQQKGALATNLQNQDRFEKHLLEQAIAKEISTLDQPDLFKEGVSQPICIITNRTAPSTYQPCGQGEGYYLHCRGCHIVPCWQPCASPLASCRNQAAFWFPRHSHDYDPCLGFAILCASQAICQLQAQQHARLHTNRRHLGVSHLDPKQFRSQSALASSHLC